MASVSEEGKTSQHPHEIFCLNPPNNFSAQAGEVGPFGVKPTQLSFDDTSLCGRCIFWLDLLVPVLVLEEMNNVSKAFTVPLWSSGSKALSHTHFEDVLVQSSIVRLP